jgi:hypothetical protein
MASESGVLEIAQTVTAAKDAPPALATPEPIRQKLFDLPGDKRSQ